MYTCAHTHTHTHTHPHTHTAEILTAPEAQPPVPFNLDDNVTYTCTVRGNSLIWQVNDAQLVTPADIMDAQAIGIFAEVIDNMDETLAGTLQITVGEGNSAVNETRVRCLAVGTSTVERDVSDFVTLITFGQFVMRHSCSVLARGCCKEWCCPRDQNIAVVLITILTTTSKGNCILGNGGAPLFWLEHWL